MLKKILPLIIFMVLLVIFALGLKHDPREIQSPLIGKKAPDFTVRLFDGGTFNLAKHKGKPVIVNFWASWCVACVEEEEVLEAAYQNNKNTDVVFIGVDIQDKKEDALEYMKQHQKSYLVARDESGEVSLDYGIYGVPETFFVNRRGDIIYKHAAPLTEDVIDHYVDIIRYSKEGS